jgi:NAD(P)-dependent dehydrogenase (short-subunit alcohol dehydrogenase family)
MEPLPRRQPEARGAAAALPRNELGARTTAQQALRGNSLAGKVAVVTGAGAGLGAETARVLALAGAQVVMAVRNVPAGEQVASRLRAGLPTGAGKLEVMTLDLANLASIRAFARALAARHPKLHLLINNAGVMGMPLSFTADGFELQMGTNHLGHFLLTNLLLDPLRAAAPARIVVVASRAHRRASREGVLATLDSDPRYQRRRYVPLVAYGESKLANILHTRALARRLAGTGVTPVCLHPGVIATDLMKHLGLGGRLFKIVGPLFTKSVAQGAATTIFAATAPELTEAHAGIYLSDCNEAQPRPVAVDADLAENVWSLSEKLVSR